MCDEKTKDAIHSIAMQASTVLQQEMEKLINKLTNDEIVKFSTNNGNVFPARLAKTLLLAVIKKNTIELEFGSETINPAVKQVLRIDSCRY